MAKKNEKLWPQIIHLPQDAEHRLGEDSEAADTLSRDVLAVVMESAVPKEVCNLIVKSREKADYAEVHDVNGEGRINQGYRITHSAHLPPEHWAGAFTQHFGRIANAAVWDLHIEHLTELSLLRYKPGGRYGWHVDAMPLGQEFYTAYDGQMELPRDWNRSAERKLSLIVNLSDPADYEGGGVQFLNERCDELSSEAARKQGSVIVFPSTVHHRVLPVTKGQRHSLVAWFGGPRLR